MPQMIKMLFLHKFMIETVHPKYDPTGILGKEQFHSNADLTQCLKTDSRKKKNQSNLNTKYPFGKV